MDHLSYESSSSSAATNKGTKEKKKGGGAGSGKRSGKAVKLSTDPQSVAARQRRHRISDRFKILQSLVPGGTKMDTVSMLEEAIHYVKFLKTQIWFHQTMINFVNDDHSLVLPPGFVPPDHQQTHMISQTYFGAHQLHSSSPPFGFPQSCYHGENPVPFDPSKNF